MVRTYKTSEATPHPLAIDDVAEDLLRGALALYPTETVYGIGVAVHTATGVSAGYPRIFSLKQRNRTQTVPWLVDNVSDLETYAVGVDDDTLRLAERFWPGALTLIVHASSAVPKSLQAGDGTVALRVSRSPVVAALIRACGCPLATTSANTHGQPAPVSFSEVEPRILEGVDVAIDGGATMCGEASTIVSCLGPSPRILREGAITSAQIAEALGRDPAPAER